MQFYYSTSACCFRTVKSSRSVLLYLRSESYILVVIVLLSRLYAPPIEVKNREA